jgi:hypothetical protein
MNKKPIRALAAICALFISVPACLIGAPKVSAAVEYNEYETRIVYQPTDLRIAGRKVSFYNYEQSQSGTATTVTADYNLNSLGVLDSVVRGGSHKVGERFRGNIRGSSDNYHVRYEFADTLFNTKSTDSNIGRMTTEDQIDVALSMEHQWHVYDNWKIKEEYTITDLGGFFGGFNESKSGLDSSTGYTRRAMDSSGRVKFADFEAIKGWKALSNNPWSTKLRFEQTYIDNSGNDAGSRGGMTKAYIIGRDDKGPSVLAVSAWSGNESDRARSDYPYEIDGDKNASFGGVDPTYITSTNTMAYIAVQFNEPIKLKDTSDLSSITLEVNALSYGGNVSATAQPIAAHFYKYAPETNDGTPAMIFQYKVPQTRADNKEVFIADSITVSSSQNSWMFENITDVAGNEYGQVRDNKTNTSNTVAFSGKTVFDFNPIKVESITVTPSPDPNAGRGEADQIRVLNGTETVNVALKLNKAAVTNTASVPQLTFAAIDKSKTGAYTTKNGKYNASARTINYTIPPSVLKNLDGELTITQISDSAIKDEAGYWLATSFSGDYIPTHENYLRDTSPPAVETTITQDADGNNIYKILVTATDDSLSDGKTQIAYNIQTDMASSGKLAYQIIDGNASGYEATWTEVNGQTIGISGNMIPSAPGSKTGYSTVYIKFPSTDTDASNLSAEVTVLDSCGNETTVSETAAVDVDSRYPDVTVEWNNVKGTGTVSATLKINDAQSTVLSYYFSTESEYNPYAMPALIQYSAGGDTITLSDSSGFTANQVYNNIYLHYVMYINGDSKVDKVSASFDNTQNGVSFNSVGTVSGGAVTPANTAELLTDSSKTYGAEVMFANDINDTDHKYLYAWVKYEPEFMKADINAGNFLANTAATGTLPEGLAFITQTDREETFTVSLTPETMVYETIVNYTTGNNTLVPYETASEYTGAVYLAAVIVDAANEKVASGQQLFNRSWGTNAVKAQMTAFTSVNNAGNPYTAEASFMGKSGGDILSYEAWGLSNLTAALSSAVSTEDKTPGDWVATAPLNLVSVNEIIKNKFIFTELSSGSVSQLVTDGTDNSSKIELIKHTYKYDPEKTDTGTTEYNGFMVYNDGVWSMAKTENETTETIKTWHLNALKRENAYNSPTLVAQTTMQAYSAEVSMSADLIKDKSFISYDDEGNPVYYVYEYRFVPVVAETSGNVTRPAQQIAMFIFDNYQLNGVTLNSVDEFPVGDVSAALANITETAGVYEDTTPNVPIVTISNGFNPRLDLTINMSDYALDVLKSTKDLTGNFNRGYNFTTGTDYYNRIDDGLQIGTYINENNSYFEIEDVVLSSDPSDRMTGYSYPHIKYLETPIHVDDGDGGYYEYFEQFFSYYIGTAYENPAYPAEKADIFRIDAIADDYAPEVRPVIERNGNETKLFYQARDEKPVEATPVGGVIETYKTDWTTITQYPGWVNAADDMFFITPDNTDLIVSSCNIESFAVSEEMYKAPTFDENGVFTVYGNTEFMITVQDISTTMGEVNDYTLISGIDNMPPEVEKAANPAVPGKDFAFSVNITERDEMFNKRYAGAEVVYTDIIPAENTDYEDADNSAATNNIYILFNEAYTEALGYPAGTEFEPGDLPGLTANITVTDELDDYDGTTPTGAQIWNVEIYGKVNPAAAPLEYVILTARDKAGNSDFVIWDDLDLTGTEAAITDDKIYTPGDTLTFNQPVTITSHISEEYPPLGYIIKNFTGDGITAVTFTDIFGNEYTEYVDVQIFGTQFEHTVTQDIITPTNQNVVLTITGGDGAEISVDGGLTWQSVATITATDSIETGYAYKVRNLSVDATILDAVYYVTNIDKIAPTATAARVMNGTYNVDDEFAGNITYIAQADEPVTFEGGNEYTFNRNTSGSHTFTFTDEAGNVGTLTVTETETFAAIDNIIIDSVNVIYSSDLVTPTNKDITAVIEAINSDGEIIPINISASGLPDGITLDTAQNKLTFTESGSISVTVSSGGDTKSVTVSVPAGIIDRVAPTGTVKGMMITIDNKDDFIGFPGGAAPGDVLLQLIISDLDTDVESVYGERVVAFDGNYYIRMESAGTGVFYLRDTAGNIGMVEALAAEDMFDTDPPEIVTIDKDTAEDFGGYTDIAEFTDESPKMTTPTSRSVSVFITFDETLGGVTVVAYPTKADAEAETNAYAKTSDYLYAEAGGKTVSLEIKQNSIIKLTVCDPYGNDVDFIFPDTPITVIDKTAPTIGMTVTDSTISFTSNEPVINTSDAESEYSTSHTVTVTQNGTYTYTFMDEAGNTASKTVTITDIDDTAPVINATIRAKGSDDKSIMAGDTLAAASEGIDIVFTATDSSDVTVEAVNVASPETALTVSDYTGAAIGGLTSPKAVTVTENGRYSLTATDTSGNSSTMYFNISQIDKAGPKIELIATNTLKVAKGATTEEAANIALADVDKVTDTPSGVNGDVTADMTDVDLNTAGVYTFTYKATDNVGNITERSRKISVIDGLSQCVNIGTPGSNKDVSAGEVYITTADALPVTAMNSGYRLYILEGFKTRGQMKYAPEHTSGDIYSFSERGYYTILARDAAHNEFVVYVSVID